MRDRNATETRPDILGVRRWLNGRYYLADEGFVTAAFFYFLIVLCVVQIFHWLERRYLDHLTRGEPAAVPAAMPDPIR